MSNNLQISDAPASLAPPTPDSSVVEKAKWASAKLTAPVIPIPNDRKGPTLLGWPEKASSDPTEIEGLFAGAARPGPGKITVAQQILE